MAFLTELFDLCQRYNADIGGCGCCGSPFLSVDSHLFDKLDAGPDLISIDGVKILGKAESDED